MSRFLAALQFLTIISIPWRRDAQETQVGRCAVYFPVVGLIIGLALAGLNWLFRLALPPDIVSALLLVVRTSDFPDDLVELYLHAEFS